FADGGGWTTEVVLVNPGDTALTGTVEFVDPKGRPVSITIDGQTKTNFSYSIEARGAQRLRTSAANASTVTGSVRVTAAATTAVPSGVVVFSFANAGTTVAEAGVPAVPAGTAFRLYGEISGDFSNGVVGSIQTGIAITNVASADATVTLELATL